MRYNHKDTVQRKQRLSHTYGELASTYYTNRNDIQYICMYTVYCQKEFMLQTTFKPIKWGLETNTGTQTPQSKKNQYIV